MLKSQPEEHNETMLSIDTGSAHCRNEADVLLLLVQDAVVLTSYCRQHFCCLVCFAALRLLASLRQKVNRMHQSYSTVQRR